MAAQNSDTNWENQVINSLIASLFIYRLSCLPTPSKEFFQKIKKIIVNFIWNGEPSKIRYNKLIQRYENSGLNLIDLEQKNIALKAAWALRVMNPDNQTGAMLYENYPIQSPLIWSCNINRSYCLEQTSSFAWQVLDAWSRLNWHTPQNVTDVMQQILWLNHFVRSKQNMLLLEAPMQAGLITMPNQVLNFCRS